MNPLTKTNQSAQGSRSLPDIEPEEKLLSRAKQWEKWVLSTKQPNGITNRTGSTYSSPRKVIITMETLWVDGKAAEKKVRRLLHKQIMYSNLQAASGRESRTTESVTAAIPTERFEWKHSHFRCQVFQFTLRRVSRVIPVVLRPARGKTSVWQLCETVGARQAVSSRRRRTERARVFSSFSVFIAYSWKERDSLRKFYLLRNR